MMIQVGFYFFWLDIATMLRTPVGRAYLYICCDWVLQIEYSIIVFRCVNNGCILRCGQVMRGVLLVACWVITCHV